MKKFGLILALFGVILSSPVSGLDRGLYVSYKSNEYLIKKPGAMSEFFSFLEKPFGNPGNSFNKVYWCINDGQSAKIINREPDNETYHQILSELRAKNVKVECVIDFTGWIDPQMRQSGIDYLQSILEFNKSAVSPEEAFDSIQLIAYPEKLMTPLNGSLINDTASSSVWDNYLGFIRSAQQLVSAHNQVSAKKISFCIALSSSYENDYYVATSFNSPMELADEIILICNSRILSSIKQNCENEVIFAQSLGKKIYISALAKYYPVDSQLSFWGFSENPYNYMNQVLFTGLSDAIDGSPDQSGVVETFSQFQVFSGIAIDGYEPQGKGGYQEIYNSVNSTINNSGNIVNGLGSGETNLTNPSDYAYYLPGFVNPANTTSKQVFFMINLMTTNSFYPVLELEHDMNLKYIYSDNDAFVKNNRDTIMQPLETGSLRIKIDTSLLPSDMQSGLSINVMQSGSTIYPKGSAIPVASNVEVTIPFFIGKILKNSPPTPLTLNLSNSNRNIMIYTQDVNKFLTLQDVPRGHLLSSADPFGPGNPVEPLVKVQAGTYVVTGEEIRVNGWCFDDNDGMAVSLIYNDSDNDADSDTIAQTSIERYVHAINNHVPYWGTTYPSGFRLKWADFNLRGFYDIKTILNDGQHTVNLDLNNSTIPPKQTKSIYWNKKPDLNIINVPATNQQFLVLDNQNFDQVIIKGEAIDVDLNMALGAYLASVELYVDGDTNKIVTIQNNSQYDTDSTYDRILYEFPYDQAYTLSEGAHTIKAVAKDTFGETIVSETQTFVIYRCVYPPVMDTVVSPRLGSWQGMNTVVIQGTNFNCVNDVKFGANSATIVDKSDSMLSVIVPTSNESKYVDIRITNEFGSTFSADGYRYIPANSSNISSDGFVDIKFNNISSKIYMLDDITSEITVFQRDTSNSLNFLYFESIDCSSTSTPLKMDISKYGTDLSVIYNSSSILNIYNLQNNSLLHSIDLSNYTNGGIFASNSSSVCSLMPRKLLAGSSGTNSGLYLIDIDSSSYTCQQILPSLNYDSVEVSRSANMAYAYILCKSISANLIDVYRFDARTDTITPVVTANLADNDGVDPQVSSGYNSLLSNISGLKISVNATGSEWLLYSNTAMSVLDKSGKLRSATVSYGADVAVYDILRDIFYTEKLNDGYFYLRSTTNLEREITFYQYPASSKARGLIDVDWTGEEMFACTSSGICAIKIGDIYPKLEIDETSRFAVRNTTSNPANYIQVNVKNAGNFGSNINLFVNDTSNLTPYSIISSSGTDYTLRFTTPNSIDHLNIFSSVYDYPSQKDDVIMMVKLYDLVPFKDRNDLGLFIPKGLFYDNKAKDLYTYDSTKTAGLLSIARFHLDNDGSVNRNKANLSSSMSSIFQPTKIARANDYIMVISNETKYAKWFNINLWDLNDASNPEYNKIYKALITPYLTNLSGVIGHPSSNIAYIWDNSAVAGRNLYQLRWAPPPAPVFKGLCTLFNGTATLMDGLIDDTGSFGFVSSLSANKISIFNPNLPYNQIRETDSVLTSGNADKLASNSEYIFVSGKNTKDIDAISYPVKYLDPNIIGSNPDSKSIDYINANDNYLVYTGKEATGTNDHTISFMDVNIWNNVPAQLNFSTLYNKRYTFANATYDVRDTVIIDNKLYAIIGRDIYVMDLPDKDN